MKKLFKESKGIITLVLLLAAIFSMASCASKAEAAVEDPTIVKAWDFEENKNGWTMDNNGSVMPDTYLAEAETQALAFDMTWTTEEMEDMWQTAPRLIKRDIGRNIGYGKATIYTFDLYLDASQTLEAPIVIAPVAQYPPTWWTQMEEISTDDIEPVILDNGLAKYSISIPLEFPGAAQLGHLVLVVVGQESGYDGTVMIDNVIIRNEAAVE